VKQLSEAEAIAFHDRGDWQPMTPTERARFQFDQECLCMPFSVFHEGMAALLGRPVWTHEFDDRERLQAEIDAALQRSS
jgi:hypothetical protein